MSEEADLEVEFRGENNSRRRWKLRDFCRVEVAAFIQTLSYGLHGVIRTNLMVDKSCLVNLNYTEKICDTIDLHQDENDQVQENVTTLNLYYTFLSSIPCIIISLLIGPLSDKYGRRPVLLIPIIGHIIGQCSYLANVYFWKASADYILLAASYALFGGNTTFLIGLYSYVADTSTTESRTSRVSVVDVALLAGVLVGTFASAPVFEKFGFTGTFGLTLALLVINFLYIFICLEESRKPEDLPEMIDDDGACDKIVDMMRTVFGARSGYSRSIILLLIICMLSLICSGNSDIDYLYTMRMFDWTESQYTRVTTAATVLAALSSLLLLPLLSYKLGVSDPMIGILAALATLVSNILLSLSTTDSLYTAACIIGVLSPMVSTVIRSLLSKTVPETDLGKVYTVLGCCEAAVPLASTPLLTLIYNVSLESFPGAVYLAEAGFILTDIILFIIITVLVKLHSRYQTLINDSEGETS